MTATRCRVLARHDVLRSLKERHVRKTRQPAAGFDLGAGPVGVIRPSLLRVQPVMPRVDAPGRVFLVTPRQVHEEHAVESLCTGELRRQLGGVVAGADEEDVRGE
jgi:hypothetical protein